MIDKNHIKYKLTENKSIYNFVRVVYSLIAHPERIMRHKSYGTKNINKTVLVIRPNSEDGVQGLMSLFVQAARWLQYAKDHNYLSFIDHKTYKTQYYDSRMERKQQELRMLLIAISYQLRMMDDLMSCRKKCFLHDRYVMRI